MPNKKKSNWKNKLKYGADDFVPSEKQKVIMERMVKAVFNDGVAVEDIHNTDPSKYGYTWHQAKTYRNCKYFKERLAEERRKAISQMKIDIQIAERRRFHAYLKTGRNTTTFYKD